MGKQVQRTFTDDFKKEAVRLTETSGRTIAQVADDLGIGLSSLTRWKRIYREADLLPAHTRIQRRNWHGFAKRTRSFAKSARSSNGPQLFRQGRGEAGSAIGSSDQAER